jgi:SsrA-binding protein
MIENRRARYDYTIVEEYQCGIMLESWEVKAVASGECNIAGSHCKVIRGEVWLVGASIGSSDHDQTRTRKLLLTRKEILRLASDTQETGLTIVPLSVSQTRGKFKLSIALVRGKREFDKRATTKKREIENENRRTIKSQQLAGDK